MARRRSGGSAPRRRCSPRGAAAPDWPSSTASRWLRSRRTGRWCWRTSPFCRRSAPSCCGEQERGRDGSARGIGIGQGEPCAGHGTAGRAQGYRRARSDPLSRSGGHWAGDGFRDARRNAARVRRANARGAPARRRAVVARRQRAPCSAISGTSGSRWRCSRPARADGTRVLNPRSGRTERMSRRTAAELDPQAVAFYPPLPPPPGGSCRRDAHGRRRSGRPVAQVCGDGASRSR